MSIYVLRPNITEDSNKYIGVNIAIKKPYIIPVIKYL